MVLNPVTGCSVGVFHSVCRVDLSHFPRLDHYNEEHKNKQIENGDTSIYLPKLDFFQESAYTSI
jgi:hypothetical protein